MLFYNLILGFFLDRFLDLLLNLHMTIDLTEQLLESILVNITLPSLPNSAQKAQTPFAHTPPPGQLRIAPGSKDLQPGAHKPLPPPTLPPPIASLVHNLSSSLLCFPPASPRLDHPLNHPQSLISKNTSLVTLLLRNIQWLPSAKSFSLASRILHKLALNPLSEINPPLLPCFPSSFHSFFKTQLKETTPRSPSRTRAQLLEHILFMPLL